MLFPIGSLPSLMTINIVLGIINPLDAGTVIYRHTLLFLHTVLLVVMVWSYPCFSWAQYAPLCIPTGCLDKRKVRRAV